MRAGGGSEALEHSTHGTGDAGPRATLSQVPPATGSHGSHAVNTCLVKCACHFVPPRPARFQFRMGVGGEGGHKMAPAFLRFRTPLPLPLPSPLPRVPCLLAEKSCPL